MNKQELIKHFEEMEYVSISQIQVSLYIGKEHHSKK